MPIRVSPTEAYPTHDVSLTDGLTTIGLHLCDPQGKRDRRAIKQGSTPRTSLQIQQGDPSYSGFNLPNTPQTQKDWSGGRGQADFARDGTRYFDSYRVNTIHGSIFLGPLETNTTNNSETTGGHTTQTAVGEWPTSAATAIFTNWTAAAPLSITSLKFKLAIQGPGGGTFTAAVYSNSGGAPTSSLAFSAPLFFSDLPEVTEIEFPLTYTFTNSTVYWIGVFFASKTGQGFPLFGYDDAATGQAIKYRYGFEDTLGLYRDNAQLYFKTGNTARAKVKFFEYRLAQYAVISKDDGSSPKLYRNGYQGLAKSNSSAMNTVQTDLDLSGAAANSLVGCRIKIIAGTGQYERVTWRTIVAHTTAASANVITVSPVWQITQDATTEFVILGADKWIEITGHGLTGPITDVLPVNELVYFAQGDAVTVRAGRFASGSWSWDDETNTTKATFMKLIPETDGTNCVWLAQATTSKVYQAAPVSWGTCLTLTQVNGSQPVGNPDTDITNLIAYGDPRTPWIIKEDGLGSIGAGGIYGEVPNAELSAVKSEVNGRAACVFGVYLFMNILEGFDRYFDQRLDDIGPNRDEGIPAGRQGPIVCARPYPGGIYCAVDAGVSGASSIMFWSSATNGWHELYRAPFGKRISDLWVQVIPGQPYQRLWFNLENDIYWLPLAINPLKAAGYPFTPTGYIISSWYKTTLGQIKKFWRDLQMFIENINSSGQVVTAAYQVDDGDWTDFPASFTNTVAVLGNASPKVLLSEDFDVTGERVRFKITLNQLLSGTTPKIIAWTISAVTRVPPSKTWSMTFQADDMNIQEGEATPEPLDMAGLLAQLERWADSEQQAAPLLMRSVIPQHDNKYVFIDQPNVSVREVQMYDDVRDIKSVGSLALYEA